MVVGRMVFARLCDGGGEGGVCKVVLMVTVFARLCSW